MSTVDVFTPIVDDARTWGEIAAANAVSDVYAMGGSPLFALNIAGWPRDELPLELLGEVLAGGASIAAAGGFAIVGGHTIDAPEPLYGMAVTGEVDEEAIMRTSGARAGDALVLTKGIGTGIVATATKRLDVADVAPGGPLARAYDAAVASMTTLNDAAAAAARGAGATACTDVTGFGLLGHLGNLLRASGVAAVIDATAVPLLPDVGRLLRDGHVPGGTQRNLEYVRGEIRGEADERTLTLFADAQTSGGLLFAAERRAADEAAAALRADGHAAAVIGHVVAGDVGTTTIEGQVSE